MAELQPPPDAPITSAAATTTAITTSAANTPVAAAAPTPAPLIIPPTAEINSTIYKTSSNHVVAPPQQSLAPKRQRRPSVRLGEIGDQPATLSYDSTSHPRRPNKTWRFHKDPTFASKSSKVRPLTNLVNGGSDCRETATFESEDNLDSANKKSKSKRSVKRVRTNWTNQRISNGIEDDDNNNEAEFRDFEPENSESPMKEQSPVHSIDNVGLDYWRPVRTRVSESRDREDGLPESNSRDRKCGTSSRLLDDGVRDWLIGLGLGRYAPIFEIHEVDDEVLTMLTLEDLKDMGINAVGSRRKMYTSIQKFRKGFS